MFRLFLAGSTLLTVVAHAADGPFVPYLGRSVANVIDDFREAGFPFAYSTNLVGDDLVVVEEPDAHDPPEIVRQILAPHKLTLSLEGSIYLVIRTDPDEPKSEDPPGKRPQLATPKIENITVSASRYEISRDVATSKFAIDQRTIQNMPDVGEDPLRIVQRLPGTAASGVSAKTHFRGGAQDEIGIMLNGQWLFDPFHVRSYQSIFSTVDPRTIEGIEVYTGGFSARYGDRMSGLVVMETLQPDEPRRNEIGISVFDTSLLTTGSTSDVSWLLSARRGNLDLVVDKEYGKPLYYDLFGEVAFDLSEKSRLSVNALYAEDEVTVILESDAEDRERSDSRTRNAQLWLRLDNRWSQYLTSSTVLSAVSYRSSREVAVNDSLGLVASVLDRRNIEQGGLRQEWSWTPSERHHMLWGLEGFYNKATFDYTGEAEYFELAALFQNQPESVSRVLSANPQGGSYAAFVSDRWKLSPKWIVEWGLRWDDQTYTGLSSDSQLSPRFNILFQPGPRTEFRFGWGRYYQSQKVQNLQIEDGIDRFWPAQHADSLIVGMRRSIADNYALRVEFFRKNIFDVRPRFENVFNTLNLVPELQVDRVRLDPTSAKATGIEVSMDYTAGKWDWWASYTLSKSTDRIGGNNVLRSWDQRHAFQGGVGWNTQSWSFNAAVSAHSGWPKSNLALLPDGVDASGDPISIAVPGPRNESRYGGFMSIDFRLSRRFSVPRGSLLTFVEVSNIFDRRNQCCLDWDLIDDGNGNNILENDVRNWLPRIPSIGILWEF